MWKIYFSNPSTSEPFCRGPQGPQEGADEEGEDICSQKNYENTQKSLSAIRAPEICISTSSEEADEATKLPKLPIRPLI